MGHKEEQTKKFYGTLKAIGKFVQRAGERSAAYHGYKIPQEKSLIAKERRMSATQYTKRSRFKVNPTSSKYKKKR